MGDRDLRNRIEGLDLGTPDQSSSGGWMIGRVVDGGRIATAGDRYYLVEPASIGGDQQEGQGATLAFGVARIPVAVVGQKAAPGDLLVCHYTGGRWVSVRGTSASPDLSCWPCPVPRRDLLASWVNPVLGDGSIPMIYSPLGQWFSACSRGLLFRMACPGSILQFGVTYFLSGECPGGQQQECSSGGVPPFSLRLESFSCDPFEAVYSLTGAGCSFLSGSGYTRFRVSAP